MKYSNPGLIFFEKEILHMSKKFNLNTEESIVESFVPNTNAIIVETVDHYRYRVHINLQEKRIISARQLNMRPLQKPIMAKYTAFMK